MSVRSETRWRQKELARDKRQKELARLIGGKNLPLGEPRFGTKANRTGINLSHQFLDFGVLGGEDGMEFLVVGLFLFSFHLGVRPFTLRWR